LCARHEHRLRGGGSDHQEAAAAITPVPSETWNKRLSSGCKYSVRLLLDAIIDHNIQRIAIANLGVGAISAVSEQLSDLGFAGHVDVITELHSQVGQADMVRRRKDREYITAVLAQHDGQPPDFWKFCARHEITVAYDRPYPVPEIASGKSFAAWLVKQVGRGDSVGDLAAAAIHNPPSGNRVRSLDGQMRHRNASPEAFDALKKAVREWITTPDGWDAFMEAEAIMSRVKNNDAAQDA
jgi:hypothetical protein